MAPVEVNTIKIEDSYVRIQLTAQLRLEIAPIVIGTMNDTTIIKIQGTEAADEIVTTIAIKAHPAFPL